MLATQVEICKMDREPTARKPSPVGEKMDDGTSEEIQGKDEDVCALFATSIPRDIWANPSLAALAGLIDEDEDQNDERISQAEQGSLINAIDIKDPWSTLAYHCWTRNMASDRKFLLQRKSSSPDDDRVLVHFVCGCTSC